MSVRPLAPHPFTLRQLQYVVAVDEERSFRKAAARCRVSQPSLSAQLAHMEDQLGVRLFERDRRRVIVTAAGVEIVARARRVLTEADDLLDAGRRALDPLAGTLRIGVIPTISPYLLPAITPALSHAHPALRAQWIEDKTEVLIASLEHGDLDGALLALEADIGDVEHAVIAEDAFVLATRAGHPLGTPKGPASTKDLDDVDVLLLDEGHCFRAQVLEVCGRSNAREMAFRATSLATLTQMVAAGAGVTLLPELAAPMETSRAQLQIRRFSRPAPHRTIALVWRKRSPLGPALRVLAETIKGAYPR